MSPSSLLLRHRPQFLLVAKPHQRAICVRVARVHAPVCHVSKHRSRFTSLKSLCSIANGSTSTHGDVTSRLAEGFHNVQHPASANKTYSRAIEDFTTAAILAYECGYTQDGIRAHLQILLQEQQQRDQDDSTQRSGNGTSSTRIGSLRSPFNEEEFHIFMSISWITLMISPKGVVTRWATSEAVPASDMGQWRGFCSHIVNGYFEKRMAWYPLDRLQLEMVAHGRKPEPQEIIAERARLVYTVLERVSPQFASD